MAVEELDGKPTGMQAQAQGQPIPDVLLPQQRDAAAGMHPDAFRRPEESLQEQQLNSFALDPNTGFTAAQIAAQSQLNRSSAKRNKQ